MGFTANRSFKIRKGLSLQERIGAAAFKAVANIKGRTFFYNTETTDFARAERLSLSWFKRLDSTEPRDTHTMPDAAKSFLSDLTGNKKLYHTVKWNAISDFFTGRDVDSITTPVLKEFLRWRKDRAERLKRSLKPHTTHKDYVTIRRILHHAVEEGWLATLPVFPKQETKVANPRPWLEPDDWTTLQRVALERITSAPDKRTKQRREDLWDFCLLMVQTCARVDEVRALRVRDCAVRQAKTIPLTTIFDTKGAVVIPKPYLELKIAGKTGTRKTIGWEGSVETFLRLVSRKGLKPDDKLFNEKHRDGFRELLLAAGLRANRDNFRNLKCLRSTGLMLRVLNNPRINLKLLATAVGSSVAMLEAFYLKPLTVEMAVEELLA